MESSLPSTGLRSPNPTTPPTSAQLTPAPSSGIRNATLPPPVPAARGGMWECGLCERSIVSREMEKHLAGKPHLKKQDAQNWANEKAAKEQRMKEERRRRAGEGEKRRAVEAAKMEVPGVVTLPNTIRREANVTVPGPGTWECEVCERSMRRQSKKSHVRGAPHMKQQVKWEAQKRQEEELKAAKDEAERKRAEEEARINMEKEKEEMKRVERERVEVERQMAEKLLIEQERERVIKVEEERRIEQIRMEEEIRRREEEERNKAEEARLREEYRERELKRVERERMEQERQMAERLWMELQEEQIKKEEEANEARRREQIRIEEENRIQEQKRVEILRIAEEKRENELNRVEAERLDREDREAELLQTEQFLIKQENGREEWTKKDQEEAEELLAVEQITFDEEMPGEDEEEFQKQALRRVKEREEAKRIAEHERIEVENFWEEEEKHRERELDDRITREQEELIRKAELNTRVPGQGSSWCPTGSSITVSQQGGASVQNSGKRATDDSGYKEKMFQYLQSQGILQQEGTRDISTADEIYQRQQLQEQAINDYNHISTMPMLVTSITDLPPILYRVYDETSVSKYTWQGFDSGVRHMPRDASQFKSMVQRHANWNSRKGTPFVSVTSSPDAAGWHVAKKQASGNESNVMVALIDTVALLGPCRTSLWKMHDAMDHFGLEPWKGDRRAYENEYICALKIPARAIFACCHPDYFMDTALAFLKSLEWREGGKQRSQSKVILTIRAPDTDVV